jgi:hypothetical protein
VSGRLHGLATQAARRRAEAQERCELCSEPIPAEHRHLLDLERRETICVCRACSILFDHSAAGGGHYRLIGDRRLRLDDLELDDVTWEQLRIPVDMAFFFRGSRERRVLAFYPSPMGATESQLGLEAWDEIEAANPILGELQPDVEALLVDRVRGARRQWLVPIDDCFRLVGLIRMHWRGLTGGREVWLQLAQFFDELDRRAKPAAPRVAAGRR